MVAIVPCSMMPADTTNNILHIIISTTMAETREHMEVGPMLPGVSLVNQDSRATGYLHNNRPTIPIRPLLRTREVMAKDTRLLTGTMHPISMDVPDQPSHPRVNNTMLVHSAACPIVSPAYRVDTQARAHRNKEASRTLARTQLEDSVTRSPVDQVQPQAKQPDVLDRQPTTCKARVVCLQLKVRTSKDTAVTNRKWDTKCRVNNHTTEVESVD